MNDSVNKPIMEQTPKPLSTKPVYICPTCGERMDRDLILFMKHTDAHVVEELKKLHPEWITNDGYCPKCLDHYKAAMRGDQTIANIAGREVSKRQLVAALSLALSIFLIFIFAKVGQLRAYRAFLVLPFFAACVGFFQMKEKHCVVLGLKGVKNTGGGEEPVSSSAEKIRLRRASIRILCVSFLTAFIMATIYYLIERKP